MLRNLKPTETYFQAGFQLQSPCSIKNPNGGSPNEQETLKLICFVLGEEKGLGEEKWSGVFD